MSVQDLKKFGKMCAEDATVRAKAKEIGLTNINKQIAYAATLGLTFTQEDMQALAKEAGVSEKELTEEQLEQVAGGCFSTLMAVVAVASLAVSAAALGAQVGTTASRDW